MEDEDLMRAFVTQGPPPHSPSQPGGPPLPLVWPLLSFLPAHDGLAVHGQPHTGPVPPSDCVHAAHACLWMREHALIVTPE